MPGMACMAGMAGLGGVGLMGSALGGNLTGIQTANQSGNINDKDGEAIGHGGVTADATTSSSANPMIQQNLLMQQLLAQQQATLGGVTGSLWQQCRFSCWLINRKLKCFVYINLTKHFASYLSGSSHLSF